MEMEITRGALAFGRACLPGEEGTFDTALAEVEEWEARLEKAEAIVANVRSRTALDVVAEKMEAVARAAALEAEADRLREALKQIGRIGDPVHGTGMSPRAQEIARAALNKE